jgi:hypothetical protein
MSALTTAEAASNERVRQRYFRPEAREQGLEILRQELLEDRPRRITISRRIATLLREREANKEALEAASARFLLPPAPTELTVTYRGPFGPLKIEVDPEWIREMLPDCSPRSRRGRRLRTPALARGTQRSHLDRSPDLRHRSPGRGEEADRRGVGSGGKGGTYSRRLRALQRSPTGRCAARGEAGRLLRA